MERLMDLVKRLSRYSAVCVANALDKDFAEAIVDAIETLKAICAIDGFLLSTKDVKAGRWIRVSKYTSRCSSCRQYWIQTEEEANYHFCPNCGARMDGET